MHLQHFQLTPSTPSIDTKFIDMFKVGQSQVTRQTTLLPLPRPS